MHNKKLNLVSVFGTEVMIYQKYATVLLFFDRTFLFSFISDNFQIKGSLTIDFLTILIEKELFLQKRWQRLISSAFQLAMPLCQVDTQAFLKVDNKLTVTG